MIVTAKMLQTLGFCIAGQRQWFADQGLTPGDYRDFVRDGMALETLAQIEDGFIQRAVELLRGQSNGA